MEKNQQEMNGNVNASSGTATGHSSSGIQTTPQPINIREILTFMKANPPKRSLDCDEIDEMLIENAKMILAYQAEVKNLPAHRPLSSRHFKYQILLEKNLLTLSKRLEPRRIANLNGMNKAKRIIQSSLINFADC